MSFLHHFFFDYYPYIAFTVFLVGSLLRYDYGQYTWRADSSQLFSKKYMFIASNLFNVGVLDIFFGHLFGMLTPHWVYEPFLKVETKQMMAMIIGGICGIMTLIGGAMLLYRRLTNERVRSSSSTADILVLVILVVQVTLGLLTIPASAKHIDGVEMMKLVGWAQSIVTFHFDASRYIIDVPLIYKLHIVLGLTIFLIFPFTRLVHIWSVPIEYLTRRYQIVKRRKQS